MNYFTLFQIPVAFAVDKAQLKHTLLTLQKQYHPDVAKDIAQPISADMLNFGYDVLVNDDKRALYLLQLQGVDVNLDTTIDDTEFLQQMMTLRMAIEEAKQTQDSVAITDLASEIAQLNAEYAKQFCAAYQQALWQQAVTAALQLRFLARLQAALQELAVTKAFDDDDLYM